MSNIPEMPEEYEHTIKAALLSEQGFVVEPFAALAEMHPSLPLDLVEEWVARILWRFRFTDVAEAS